MNLPTERLINELQTFGVRLADPKAGVESRRGGAGPSDHKALTIDGVTVMAPVHTAPAFESPYVIDAPGGGGKVPINPEYVLCRQPGRVLVRNYEGKIFEYPENADGTPKPHAKPEKIEEPDLCKCD